MFESIKGYLTAFNQAPQSINECKTESSTSVAEAVENSKDFTFSIEATLKDRLKQAKQWSSQVYERAIKSSETPTHFIKSQLENQLSGVDLNSVVKKVPLLREFQQSQSEFEAEQRIKNPELNETNSQTDSICLPWHPDCCGLTDQRAVTDLQTRILALSQHPNTFLLQPPAEAQLGTASSSLSPEQWQLAKLLLKEDPNLDKMRYKLVPSRISEDLFWRNYFYRINLLRQSAHLASVAGASASLADTLHDPENFVYIEENYDTEHTTADDADHPSKDSRTTVTDAGAQKFNEKISCKTRKNESRKPVTPSDPTANNLTNVSPPKSTADIVKQAQQDSANTDRMPSVDELLDAELAREVDELVLVSSNDPLTDQLDRELEMELLAEIDQTNK